MPPGKRCARESPLKRTSPRIGFARGRFRGGKNTTPERAGPFLRGMNWLLLLLLPLLLLLAYGIYHRGILGEGPAFRQYWSSTMRIDVERLRVRKIPYGEDDQQYLLFCEPTGNTTQRPVIFHIHGGGWRYGRPDYFLPQAQLLGDAGFATIMVCHRKAPRHKATAQRDDVVRAYRAALTLLDQSERYRNAPLIAFGISSGGNHAALLTYDRARAARLGYDVDRIRALATFGAPLDLRGMKWSTILRSYAGSRRSAMYREANPVNFLHADTPRLPFLAIHGRRDAVVQYAAGERFWTKLEAIHPGSTTVVPVRDGRHLTAVAWTYQDGELRERMLAWLDAVARSLEVTV